MGAFTIIALILATVFIIAGTAMNWNVYRIYAYQSFDGKSAHQYTFLCFPFALIAAILNAITFKFTTSGRVIWRYLFYGLLYYIVVEGPSKLQTVDDYRAFYSHTQNGGTSYSQWTFVKYLTPKDIKTLLAGAILNYIGLLLCLATVHGKWAFKCSVATFLNLIAIALGAIGIIIVYANKATMHLGNYRDLNNNYGEFQIDRADAFVMASSLIVLLLIVSGSVFHEHADGAHAAMVGLGTYGVWYLADGFNIVKHMQYLQPTSGSGSGGDRFPVTASDIQKAWAGSLFCWFSAWVILLTARFAVVDKENEGGKSSKVVPMSTVA